MGVIIKSVDMPENCLDCYCYDGWNGICKVTKNSVLVDIPKWCPLKSVDGLIDEIKLLPNANTDYWNIGGDTVDREDLIDAVKEYCGEEQ